MGAQAPCSPTTYHGEAVATAPLSQKEMKDNLRTMNDNVRVTRGSTVLTTAVTAQDNRSAAGTRTFTKRPKHQAAPVVHSCNVRATISSAVVLLLPSVRVQLRNRAPSERVIQSDPKSPEVENATATKKNGKTRPPKKSGYSQTTKAPTKVPRLPIHQK